MYSPTKFSGLPTILRPVSTPLAQPAKSKNNDETTHKNQCDSEADRPKQLSPKPEPKTASQTVQDVISQTMQLKDLLHRHTVKSHARNPFVLFVPTNAN